MTKPDIEHAGADTIHDLYLSRSLTKEDCEILAEGTLTRVYVKFLLDKAIRSNDYIMETTLQGILKH